MPGMFCVAASAEVKHVPRAEAIATPAAAQARPQPNDGNDGYVGSIACSRCHAEIYSHFVKTNMGRSMTAVTPELLKTLPASKPIYIQKFDRYYEAVSKDGKFYQSEYQLDVAGKDVFRDTHEIKWIIGTSTTGLGGLVTHDGYLFQAPLSYYPRTGLWNLSPGYQWGDYGFSRLIAPGCIFCHSGRPQPVAGALGKYKSAPFAQTAVGCENCHGPGSAHVQAMGDGESYDKGKDPTIVNPANLTPALADDICMSCHQTGDARVFQPGRNYQDFRPGTPLSRVMAILMIPPTRENPPAPDHAQHYYSMIMSKCYQASAHQPGAKQMRCISCHDPHVEPASAEAPAFFNGKCMSCHTVASCTAAKQSREQTRPADNCIACHMPRHENPALAHSSITNHRIVTSSDEPYPDAVFAQTSADLPDLIYLNGRLQGALNQASKQASDDGSALSGVALLEAYGQLREQWPEYSAAWSRTLNALEKTDPEKALVQASLGHRDMDDGKLDEASVHLRHALELDPAQPAVYADLSALAAGKGQVDEAVELARKAVILDPFNAAPRKTFVLRLIDAKRYEEALPAMEKYLQDFPEDDLMRKMLAIAKAP